jgi:hypothetical protein
MQNPWGNPTVNSASILNLPEHIRWLNIPKYENKCANTQIDIFV